AVRGRRVTPSAGPSRLRGGPPRPPRRRRPVPRCPSSGRRPRPRGTGRRPSRTPRPVRKVPWESRIVPYGSGDARRCGTSPRPPVTEGAAGPLRTAAVQVTNRSRVFIFSIPDRRHHRRRPVKGIIRHSPAAPVAGFATPVPTGRTTGGTSRVGRSPPRGTGPVPYRAPSVQVVAQHLRTRGVAQLGHGLGLDLPDPFPGHAVDLAD